MIEDDLVTIANRTEVKADIYSNTNLDQKYSRSKRLLKMKYSDQEE